jgi:hypothetical protein
VELRGGAAGGDGVATEEMWPTRGGAAAALDFSHVG